MLLRYFPIKQKSKAWHKMLWGRESKASNPGSFLSLCHIKLFGKWFCHDNLIPHKLRKDPHKYPNEANRVWQWKHCRVCWHTLLLAHELEGNTLSSVVKENTKCLSKKISIIHYPLHLKITIADILNIWGFLVL